MVQSAERWDYRSVMAPPTRLFEPSNFYHASHNATHVIREQLVQPPLSTCLETIVTRSQIIP